MTEISHKKQRSTDGPPLPRSLQRNLPILLKLRELYGSVEDQSIPERFLDLLDRLEQASQDASSVAPK